MDLVAIFLVTALVSLLVGGAAWFVLGRSRPDKVDKRYRNVWGRRQRDIKYKGGKRVRQTWRTDWFGRRVKTTYVQKKCFRCGATVRSDNTGRYRCSNCGNTFR